MVVLENALRTNSIIFSTSQISSDLIIGSMQIYTNPNPLRFSQPQFSKAGNISMPCQKTIIVNSTREVPRFKL
ncbi:hypothetical protein BpHYR1_048188 [Brachionus plicatilis]|uniref:Uncharacterized protein n=1 Tax=Brachionus plicatilis TaxID=10195 RepID=A0A3M7RZA2_BRAPC|nr:hypothetical protein BpHYR1_048188 [Brachionus plicatilis]